MCNRRALPALVALSASSAFACSGPGAEDAIDTSLFVGLGSIVVIVVVAVLHFIGSKGRSFMSRALFAPLVVVHPLWLFGVSSGDCGYLARWTSLGLAVVVAAGALVLRSLRRRSAA